MVFVDTFGSLERVGEEMSLEQVRLRERIQVWEDLGAKNLLNKMALVCVGKMPVVN